jgi:hypothetical protein
MSFVCNATLLSMNFIKMFKMLTLICICLAAASQIGTTASSDPLENILANDAPYFTTSFGQPVFSENASLTVGPRGETFIVVPATQSIALTLARYSQVDVHVVHVTFCKRINTRRALTA